MFDHLLDIQWRVKLFASLYDCVSCDSMNLFDRGDLISSSLHVDASNEDVPIEFSSADWSYQRFGERKV